MYVVDTAVVKADMNYLFDRVRQMMNEGIKVGNIQKTEDYLNDLIEDLKDEIKSKYGIANPNSSPQVAGFMQELAGKFSMGTRNDIVSICYDIEKGKWSTTKENLGALAELGYEFARDVLTYRSVKKYLDNYKGIREHIGSDGCIHPIVSSTKTNRVTYSEPNLVGIKKDALWNIIVPKDEKVLYSVDFKNEEPVVLFNLIGDEEMLGALQSEDGLYNYMFKQVFKPVTTLNILLKPGVETHKLTREELLSEMTFSADMFEPKPIGCNSLFYNGEKVVAIETICYTYSGVGKLEPPKTVAIETESGNVYDVEVDWSNIKVKGSMGSATGELRNLYFNIIKSDRNQFKRSWLAYTYGASIRSVAKVYCKTIDGNKVSKYISGIKSFKEYRKLVERAVASGCTSIRSTFGNVIYIDEATEDQQIRTMLNCPMQSTGSDILAVSVKHFDDEVSRLGIADKMNLYFTRHDEVIVSVDKKFAEGSKESVEQLLKNMFEMQIVVGGKPWTPLKVEVEKIEYTKPHFDFLDNEEEV